MKMKCIYITKERLNKLGFKNIGEYTNSRHWYDLRKSFYGSGIQIMIKGKFSCSACKRTGIPFNIHHKNYYRLGNEKLTDLVLLCSDCHKLIHNTFDKYAKKKLINSEFLTFITNHVIKHHGNVDDNFIISKNLNGYRHKEYNYPDLNKKPKSKQNNKKQNKKKKGKHKYFRSKISQDDARLWGFWSAGH
jgi:hypothetical protein